MKIQRSIFWFIIVAMVLIIVVLWFGKKKPMETPPLTSIETNAAPQAAIPNQPVSMPADTNMPTARPVTTNVIQPSSQNNKWEQIQPILATQNDIPIDFYGRVEDQLGNGVADATVNFSVGVYNGRESTEKRGQVTTDDNGFFTITGYKGYNLGLMPEKAGYVLATTGTLFKYSHLERHPYVSDPNNPTVLKMWKLQGSEHLISFNIQTYIPVNGTSVIFDLQTGQRVQSGGDLIIQVTSPVNPSLAVGYDWQAIIQIINGGIIQSSGLGLQKMFQAPDSGYEPEFDLSFQKGTQLWTSRFNDDFYFTSQGDKYYGKMWLEIDTDVIKNNAALVTMRGYLNPSGSRNLELGQQQ